MAFYIDPSNSSLYTSRTDTIGNVNSLPSTSLGYNTNGWQPPRNNLQPDFKYPGTVNYKGNAISGSPTTPVMMSKVGNNNSAETIPGPGVWLIIGHVHVAEQSSTNSNNLGVYLCVNTLSTSDTISLFSGGIQGGIDRLIANNNNPRVIGISTNGSNHSGSLQDTVTGVYINDSGTKYVHLLAFLGSNAATSSSKISIVKLG